MANRYWVGGTGTWNTTSTTNWSASSGGASGASVPTAADSVFFDSATTYTVTMTGALTCLDLTVSAGTVTFATGTTPTLAVSGSWSTTASTVWNSTGTITFNATTSKTVNSNGITLNCNVTFNGVAGTWTLQSNFVAGTTRTVTLTNGTLALSTFTLTSGLFSSSNSNTRTLDFGTGKIALNSATTSTVFTVSTSTNFAVSGTPLIECSGGGTGVTKTINTGTTTEAQAISFSLLESTGTATYDILGNVAAGAVKNLILNGSQTLTSSGASSSLLIYGSFTHLTTGGTTTFSSSLPALQFSATSGNYTITPAAVTYGPNFYFGQNGASTATWTLAGNLTLGPNTSSATYRIFRLYSGTLSLSTYTMTAGAFQSNFTNTRTLDFGTGKIVVNYSDASNNATVWDTSTITGMSVSGTPLIECTGGGGTTIPIIKTITTGGTNQANAFFNFSLLETTGTLTKTYAFTNGVKNLTINGLQIVGSATLYGNFVYNNTNGSSALGSNTFTFSGASGTQTITSNGLTVDTNFTINGTGGSVQLQGALTMGSTRTLTHSNGTLDLNGYTLTVGTAYTTATGTKNLTFNGGTLVCPTASVTAFNNAAPTGYTTTAGTGTGKISMTSATAKTFVGGGSTFNCTLSNDGAGAMTITGSNTFTTLANGVQPTTIRFTAGTTTTVTNWNVSGTAGNLVTIGSATAAQHTLSKASGTVNANYLSISYSNATGGATWYAGSTSTNGGNNTGWIFGAGSSGNFFMLFN